MRKSDTSVQGCKVFIYKRDINCINAGDKTELLFGGKIQNDNKNFLI